MSDPCLDTPYWSQDAAALMTTLKSGPGGLSSEKATALLRQVGPNVVEDSLRLSALRLLLRQFESPLVLILIFAAAISLVLQQWMGSTIVLAIVLGSTLLGFFQEYRASAAVEEPSAVSRTDSELVSQSWTTREVLQL
jgi:Mg2+-importing ATPase